MNSRKQTLINLDKVLGTVNTINQGVPIQKPKAIPKPIPILEPQINVSKERYLKLIENINGRCATIGYIWGKSVYDYTGDNLEHQITSAPDNTVFEVLAISGVISVLSSLFHDKYKENEYSEKFESIFLKFMMLRWLVIIIIQII